MFLGQVFLNFIFIFYGEPILKVHGSFPVTHLFLYDTQPVRRKDRTDVRTVVKRGRLICRSG